MKRLLILALTLLTILVACSASQADFRCGRRTVVAPCYTPCHEVVHEAVIAVPTVTTIIQQAVPTFLFQYNPFPVMPQAAMYGQQQYQQPASQQFQMPPQAPPVAQAGSMSLSDAQLAKIADLVVLRLQGGMVASSTNLVAPPMLAADEPVAQQPIVATQSIVQEIGTKCASCHQTGVATKGGLSLFDANGTMNPLKNGVAYATPQRLWERASDGSMPPQGHARLNADAIAFLRSAVGQ